MGILVCSRFCEATSKSLIKMYTAVCFERQYFYSSVSGLSNSFITYISIFSCFHDDYYMTDIGNKFSYFMKMFLCYFYNQIDCFLLNLTFLVHKRKIIFTDSSMLCSLLETDDQSISIRDLLMYSTSHGSRFITAQSQLGRG